MNFIPQPNTLAAARQYAEKQAALAADYVERARAIAPLVERDAEATERGSMITAAVHDAFAANNLYWMAIPEELGGPGLGPVAGMQVIEEIACADGSSGWSLMANAFNNAMAAGHMPDEGAHLLWGGKQKAITCGQFAAVGKGVVVDGGVRGGGHYRFGSGSGHADWIGGGVVIHENGRPRMLENGQPDMRVLHVPMSQARMCGNWDVIGLVGTASFDYELDDLTVPSHLIFSGDPVAEPLRGGPLLHVGWFGIGAAGHTAIVLGIMRRALQEVARIVFERPRLGYSVHVHEHPVFKHEFTQHEASYWAARGLAHKAFGAIEAAVSGGGKVSAEELSRLRQACSHAHNTAVEVVRFCHRWGASESFRNPTALGRCTRDMAVATQHVIADEAAWSDCADPIYRSWLPTTDGSDASVAAAG
jgi:alkylation response protein AidB-like acyl-CoA dehydrogenase